MTIQHKQQKSITADIWMYALNGDNFQYWVRKFVAADDCLNLETRSIEEVYNNAIAGHTLPCPTLKVGEAKSILEKKEH